MSLRFIPLGVGDAFSRKYYSSCLLVTDDQTTVLIDCPHPIRKILFEGTATKRPFDIQDIDAVVLTHLHGDHCSGLEDLMFFNRFHLDRKTTVAAHSQTLDRLWRGHLEASMGTLKSEIGRQQMQLENYANTIPLNENEAVNIGSLKIECRPTDHHIHTVALRIHAPEGSLGCSADTAFDPSLIEWLAQCDVIIHETNLGDHTPYSDLLTLSEEVKAKMFLIHYPDDFETASSEITALEQGRVYTIPRKAGVR